MNNKIMLIDPCFKEGLKGFPLGLAYIAGALKEEHDVCAVDLTARATIERRNPEEILAEELLRFNPDVVGITSTSPTHKEALNAAKAVKRIADIPIIKGGPHETICAETTIRRNPCIDYSVVGEGEETIVELVRAILNGRSVRGVSGVVFRENGIAINNGNRNLILNLDSLPKPARELLYLDENFDRYYSAKIFEGRKSTSVMASRGCPYSCSFCSSKTNWGNIRQRSVDSVMSELTELYSQGFKGFMFEDDMFLLNRKWFLEFADRILKEKIDIRYSPQTRVDRIDEKIAEALASSGCSFIYFGVESGVQTILDSCGKGITIEQAKKAFDIIRRYGIKCMASIQFGLPGEDLEGLSTVRETIRVLNDILRPDEAAFSYTCLYPGSPLAVQQGVTPEMYESYERTQADSEIYAKTAHGSNAIHPNGLTPQKIIEIEELIEKELKIKRFEVGSFYKV